MQRELILLIILTIGIMLIISESISIEYKTGMEDIVRSYSRGRNWLLYRKVIASIGITLILFFIVYGIDLYLLNRHYGFPYLEAPVQSLSFMKDCKLKTSVGGWIGVRLRIRLIFSFATMTAAILISRILGKKGNRSLTIFIIVILIVIILALFGTGGRF